MSGTGGILAGYESLRAGQKAFYKDLQQAGLPGCACGCPGWPGGDTRPAVPHPCGYFDLVLAAALQSGPRRHRSGAGPAPWYVALPWSMPSWAPRAALDAVAATDPDPAAAHGSNLRTARPARRFRSTDQDRPQRGPRRYRQPCAGAAGRAERKEEPEAHELFALACDELGLTPTLPPDPGAACWELIRWLSERIVAGDLAPEDGAWLIEQSWLRFGNPRITPPSSGHSSAGAIQWAEWTRGVGHPTRNLPPGDR